MHHVGILYDQDNVVCIVTGLRAGLPARARDFPLLQNVHTSSMARALFSMGAGVLSCG